MIFPSSRSNTAESDTDRASLSNRQRTLIGFGCGCLGAPLALVILWVGLILFATGSGEWDDSRKNWNRAFGDDPPASVEVLHSHYWKSPHWSYEASYCFQIRITDDKLLDELKAGFTLSNSNVVDYDYWMDTPEWFPANGTLVDEIWIDGNAILIIDERNNVIYMADWSA